MSIVRVLLVLSYACQAYTNTTSATDLNQTDVLGEIYVRPNFKEQTRTSPVSELPPPTVRPSQSFFNTAQRRFQFHLGTLSLPVPVNDREELTFKWHVAVYSTRLTPFVQICGGSLVTRSVAISAAHCFWEDLGLLPASQFAVAAGKRYRRWIKLQLHASNVSEIIIPPRFLGEKTNFQHDIAVVKMVTPVPTNLFTAQPLCVDFDLELDRRHLTSGNLGTITGFGLTEENGSPSNELNYQALPYVDIRDCINASPPSFLKYLTGDKICAGDQHTGRALCRGDSGGGLVFFEGNSTVKVPYLRGIASAAPRNEHKCNAFAIGSFTHLRTHRTFLRDHIPGLEEECRTVYAKVRLPPTQQPRPTAGTSRAVAEIAKNRSIASHDKNAKENVTKSDRTNIESDASETAINYNEAKVDGNTEDNASQTATNHNETKFDGNMDDTSVTDLGTGKNGNDDNNTDPIEEETTDVNLLKTFPKKVQAIVESSAPKYQWHTTIYSTVKRPYLQICGGTLVKRDVIISAAHCFKEELHLSSPEHFAAAAGKLHRPWGDPRDEYAQYSEVKQIVIHEEFRAIKTKMRSCYQHDMAVLTLATPFSYSPGVKPACVDFGGELDREHLMSGSFGKFVGWGNIQRNCELYNSLLYRELPYLDLGCIADFSFSNFDMISDNDVCASLNIVLSDERVPAYVRIRPPCNIDSGGGLTYFDKRRSNIVPYLRGVATATIAGNPCNHYILDTFTHLRAEREFLKTVIPDIEEECDGAYPEVETKDLSSHDRNLPVNIDGVVNGDEEQIVLNNNNDNDRPILSNGKHMTLNATSTAKTDIPNSEQLRPNPNVNFHRPNTNPTELNTDRAVMWKKKYQTTTVKPTFGMSEDSSDISFPWHVGVYSKAWMPYMLICGGSLVKKEMSCFLVRELLFPDRFFGVRTNYQADIAVLRLSTTLMYGARVKPICVSFNAEAEKQQLRKGTVGTFPGWALTPAVGNMSGTLNFIDLPFVDIKQCVGNSPPSLLRYMTGDKICFGNQKSSRHLCKSDTGGGLAYFNPYPILRGISTQILHDICEDVTISLFTDISSHAAFLRDNVADVERECDDVYGKWQVDRNRDSESAPTPTINLVCNCNCDNSSRYRYTP